MAADTAVLVDGLHFGEGPRWRSGRLVLSDFYDHRVISVGLDGEVEALVAVPGQPSGIGWLPDGRMLVVSMTDLCVMRLEHDGRLVVHADLAPHARFLANDMVVDTHGRAYVGNFGFDLHGFLREHGEAALFDDPTRFLTPLCIAWPDGTVEVAAEDMAFPNGSVITPDGATLIVAETLALRLTAFDIDADGRLGGRRVWADLSAELVVPDGICLDAGGGVWAANAVAPEAVRITEGGGVTDRVATTQNCYAVALGGEDGHTLFACTAEDSDAVRAARARTGAIEIVRVRFPAA